MMMTIYERIENAAGEMCDHYCKWPMLYDEDKEDIPLSESAYCKECPLTLILAALGEEES